MTTAVLERNFDIDSNLPDTLAELIKLASADIKTFDRSVFHPRSSEWYAELSDKYCMGCFAGALLYSRLKEHVPTDILKDNNFILSEHIIKSGQCDKMLALNSFRGGFIDEAIYHMHGRHIDIGREDLKHLEDPPNAGVFLNWDEMDLFLEWADRSAEILRKYEKNLG